MKVKGVTTIALSCAAILCSAIGAITYVKSAANQSAGQQTPSAVETGNVAYSVGKSESVISYGKDNNSDVMGLQADLFGEDTLTLHNVIDLNDMYKNGQTFLEIHPTAVEVGFADYKSIVVEMVDVYNKDNFLKIQMSTNPDAENESSVSYFLACASNGQKLTGYEWDGDPKKTGTLHVGNDFGQWSYYSFGDMEKEKGGTGFYYDVANKSIYAKPLNGTPKKQIIDFDDPTFFGSYLWEGFTTNEVYCTIRCAGYKKETASFLVSKYGNYNLAKMELTDEVAPILNVDFGDYAEENLPDGLINYSYPIFDASARDAVDGAVDVDVEVLFGYDTTSPQQVAVKNGVFKPSAPGSYQIRYSATDAHGNTAEKFVYVDVKSAHPNLEVVFDDVVTEMLEGDLYQLSTYEVSNALGNPVMEIKATLNGKAIEVTEKGIRPFVAGEMKVTYTIKDFVGRKVTETYTITVNTATKPTFIDEPLLPKRFVVGNTYALPTMNAYNYVTSQGDVLTTRIYVKENGVERELVDGKYTVGSVSAAEIIYKATIGDATGEWKKIVPVYDVKTNGYLDMSKYFLPMNDKGSAKTTASAVDLCVSGNTEFEFLNYVTVYPFITEFTYGANPARIGKFHVWLRDIADEKKALKFTYDFNGGAATFYVNDNQNLTSTVSVALKEGARNQLVFKADERAVYFDINKGSGFPISTFYDGQAFTGFTNERVYVTYAFEGVNGEANIGINNLNLTYLSNDNGDYMAPLVSLIGKVGGQREINEVVQLPKIVANDVFAGDVDAYITVKTPSGQFATTENGILLNNCLYNEDVQKIKLTEYGKYEVRVIARDDAGNDGQAAMVIRVVDTEVPTLKLSGELVTTAKVGDQIALPAVTVGDNLTQNCTTKIYVVDPNGHLLDMSAEKGFSPTRSGLHTVLYYVMDEAGNFASECFKITVK